MAEDCSYGLSSTPNDVELYKQAIRRIEVTWVLLRYLKHAANQIDCRGYDSLSS